MPEALHISTYIDRPPAEVYAFASRPENLSRWAAGLARSEGRREGDAWVVDAPIGTVRVRFAAPNAFGVMDHDVELGPGQVFHNPMRVVPNGSGNELMFTLLRRPDMTDAQFQSDRQAIETDLATLKALLERRS